MLSLKSHFSRLCDRFLLDRAKEKEILVSGFNLTLFSFINNISLEMYFVILLVSNHIGIYWSESLYTCRYLAINSEL